VVTVPLVSDPAAAPARTGPPPWWFRAARRVRTTARALPLSGWALGCTVLGCGLWLWWSPQAPDLAAQVARAQVAGRAPWAVWWTGWFAGLSLPTYSVLSPQLMASIGVTTSGVFAVVTGSLGTARLAADARRPRTGAAAFALAQLADLFAGRVTFALGFAAGAWALVALRSRRGVAGAGLALLTFLLSPLAGLFLGMVTTAVALCRPRLRRVALAGATVLLGVAVTLAWLVPDPGTMPFSVTAAEPAVLAAVVVAVLCPPAPVRIGALLALAATLAFLVVPGAVGVNITRLSWIVAVPVVLACASPPPWLAQRLEQALPGRPGTPSSRATAAVVVGLAAAGVAVAPVSDLVVQVRLGSDRSADPAFYAPLNQALASRGVTPGARVEVVDPANHWSAAYVTADLARGWERQADLARNPIFYGREPLTEESYHAWLQRLAVGWVAVPAVPLDGAAQAEASLVASGPAYLEREWASADWTLFRVRDAAALADVGRVVAVTTDSVTLAVDGPGAVHLSLRWSPDLTLLDPASGRPAAGCVEQDGAWVRVRLPSAGTVRLTARVDLPRRLGWTAACTVRP